MKKLTFLGLALSALFSCSKNDIKKWLGKPDRDKPPVPCKIDSIYPVDEGHAAMDVWVAAGIHYNDKNNPSVVNYTIQHYGRYSFPLFYKYDNKNRLTELLPVRPEGWQELDETPKHVKFVYEGNSQLPVRDSILSDTIVGQFADTLFKVYTVTVEDLYYDAQGRVNRVVMRSYGRNASDTVIYPVREVKYYYDANGNRQVSLASDGSTPAPISYTDKPSLFSLHPVWKLIHKNWSKNSVEGDVHAYNSYGLPTQLNLSREPFLFAGVHTGINPLSNITYTCWGTAK